VTLKCIGTSSAGPYGPSMLPMTSLARAAARPADVAEVGTQMQVTPPVPGKPESPPPSPEQPDAQPGKPGPDSPAPQPPQREVPVQPIPKPEIPPPEAPVPDAPEPVQPPAHDPVPPAPKGTGSSLSDALLIARHSREARHHSRRLFKRESSVLLFTTSRWRPGFDASRVPE
jgi:hypothetical protein